MNLAYIKLYLKIEHDDEDAFLKDLLLAAKEFVTNAVGKIDETSNLYSLALLLLIAHFYENREVFVADNNRINEVPYSLEAMILQLRYRKDPHESSEVSS